jgi:hypothetical protein
MANLKKIHYNMDEIDKIGARFNLIYGERSNREIVSIEAQKRCRKIFKNWSQIYFNEEMERRNNI